MRSARIFTYLTTALLACSFMGCSLFCKEEGKEAVKAPVKAPAKKAVAKPAPKKAVKKAVAKPAPKKAVKKAAAKPTPKKAVKKAAAKPAPYRIALSLNKKNGLYKKGENVVITLRFLKDGKLAAGQKILYTIRGEKERKIITSLAKGNTITLKAEKPWTMVTFAAVDAKGKTIRYKVGKRTRAAAISIGFMTDVEKIKTGTPEPADFDAFWNNARKELAKVPVKVLEKKPKGWGKRFQGKINIYDMKIACAGKNPVSGYLSIPVNAKKRSLPAIVYYHGAGVRSSSPKPNFKAITFDVNAHGILNGQNVKYYQNLYKTTLRSYYRQNAHDRNKFYFRDMIFRVQRALDYVKSLPEWNGKDLIVYGGSQGGAQALIAGGLDKDVTLIYSFVPALCDHTGFLAGNGREAGWPRLIPQKNGKPTSLSIFKTASYFDAAYFAKRIKGEAYLTVGLIDTTCVPTSVYAAFNNIPGKKKTIEVYPFMGHSSIMSPAFRRRLNKTLSAAEKAVKAQKK